MGQTVPPDGVVACRTFVDAGRWTSFAAAAVAAERRTKLETTLECSMMGSARLDQTLVCLVPEKSRMEPSAGLWSCIRGASCGSDSIACARMGTTVGGDDNSCWMDAMKCVIWSSWEENLSKRHIVSDSSLKSLSYCRVSMTWVGAQHAPALGPNPLQP